MNIPYSRWQTQRRCLPDKVELNIMFLIKVCSRLNLTYQIYYLAEEAERRKVQFILRVPKGCRISAELRQFIKEHQWTKLERFEVR
ncbi:hypothetical protein D1641_16575 [Colidextribacter sp. OB.20]|uniref:hypothetical protein n=1 Tax=Colidextribacter sp. OB.20 TaxID=2304568 RepID=UPI00136ED629|nr:hypothetical protein [Colidextribacter sp. OB.20]NBI11592.1 hypothetical protein [Colidextribacter sp. OB.20]